MKIAIYSTHKFEKEYLEKANSGRHTINFIDSALSPETVNLAEGCEAVCIFVNDNASAPVLQKLNKMGVKYLALRSAGFNNVDLEEVKNLKMRASRVSKYSPYSVAEHTLTLMLALNRKIIRSHSRIREQNFSLDGLTGFDMNGKTVGVIGTGKIGSIVIKILHGFGCKLLAYDTVQNEQLKKLYNVTYTTLEKLYAQSDIITLHVPLNEHTKFMIDKKSLAQMKTGVMLINTSRGKLVKTIDIISSLKTGHIGYLGLDVYEEEEGLFFEDHSENVLQDDLIARLITFPNVIITSHQAFLTDTALTNIAETTFENLNCFEENTPVNNSNHLV